ncbi:MAG: GxxExxY protein [Rubripirellula sp.]
MHRLFTQASEITREVIGSAIEVHREKGPGFLESIYEWCMRIELELRGYQVKSQGSVVVHWKQFRKEYAVRFDLLANDCLLVEVKAWNQSS